MRRSLISPLVLALALAHGAHAAAPLDGVTPAALRVGADARGEITTGNRLNLSDGSRSAVFQVRLAAGQAVRFELSGALRGRIAVLDNGDFVAGSGNGGSLTYRSERGGDVLVAVSGADGDAYGPFVLRAVEQAVYGGGPLRPGMDVTDWMQGDSKRYTLQIAEAGLYAIDMMSSEFDSVLEISGPSGIFNEDDGGESSLDARIATVLEPGTYTVNAKSYGKSGGLFSLKIAAQPLPAGVSLQAGGALPLDGSSISGLATSTGATYTLTVPERGAVTIDMRSSDIDSFLELSGQGLEISDDDGGDNLDARIFTVLQPGTYTVRAKSLGTSTGVFSLSATLGPVPEGTGGGSLRVGTPQTATLLSGARDTYTFTVGRAGNYVIDMTASDLDSYLTLQRDGADLATDDDGGESLNARIAMRLERGTYTVVASALGGSQSGTYTIGVRQQ